MEKERMEKREKKKREKQKEMNKKMKREQWSKKNVMEEKRENVERKKWNQKGTDQNQKHEGVLADFFVGLICFDFSIFFFFCSVFLVFSSLFEFLKQIKLIEKNSFEKMFFRNFLLNFFQGRKYIEQKTKGRGFCSNK